MLKGVNILADAVKVTLGPRPQRLCSTNPLAHPTASPKTVVSVAKRDRLEDKFENNGRTDGKEVLPGPTTKRVTVQQPQPCSAQAIVLKKA